MRGCGGKDLLYKNNMIILIIGLIITIHKGVCGSTRTYAPHFLLLLPFCLHGHCLQLTPGLRMRGWSSRMQNHNNNI